MPCQEAGSEETDPGSRSCGGITSFSYLTRDLSSPWEQRTLRQFCLQAQLTAGEADQLQAEQLQAALRTEWSPATKALTRLSLFYSCTSAETPPSLGRSLRQIQT